MWKKIIAAIIVIIILMGAAFAFPLAINYYSDKSHINKIQYVESKDIDLFSLNEERNIASNLETINRLLGEYASPGYVPLNFEPSEEKLNEVYDKVKNEMEQWFSADIMGLEATGIQLNLLSDFEIEDVRLYSYDKISFFQIDAVTAESDTSIRINMDSNYYKIYSVAIYGGIVEKIEDIYTYNMKLEKKSINDVMEQIADKIVQYYGVDMPQIMVGGESLISYRILSNLEWSVQFYNDQDISIIEIGILEF
ncbi:MAG: hypothetical protein ACLRZ9_03765 [Eubacterium sp.]